MYKTVWKCRLCGERFTGERNIESNVLADIIADKQVMKSMRGHGCYGGDVGIADFQGFKKLERVEKDG